MKQTRSYLPVYASDVSGAASALYELGGLVVIHDPSGCNSTYNTHDEIRWYEKDSLIFISALTQRDAITGNDKKLYNDILSAAGEFNPAFIAITNSPVPYLTGTDFNAIAKKLEKECGIPVFYVPANGMHDYTTGAGRAFLKAAERLVLPRKGKPAKRSVNIIGMTPLDYAAKGSAAAIRGLLEDGGFTVKSVWAMDEGTENIPFSGEAAVNLVVSSAGLYAAEKLKEKFGTPYVAGTFAGSFSETLIDALCEAEDTGICKIACMQDSSAKPYAGETPLTIIGEPIISGSLASAVRRKYGCPVRVVCPTEIYKGLISDNDIKVSCEEETVNALKGVKNVIADPLYRYILPEGAKLYELASLSLSGRIYLKKMRPLAQLEL